MNKLEEARKYLNIMQDLRLRSPQNQYFIQYCQKIEADLYFAKPDLESLLYAKQIYEEIITGPFTWFLIYYPSVYNLLEILFSEYSITKNDLLITRIKDLLALTKEDLENKAYYVQLVKFLILETKWYVLTQNASEAFHSLEKGFKLADTYGYVDLSKLIMRIYQFIQTRIDVTGDLTYKLSELASLFDMTRINDEEEINENTELMTYSSQLLGLRETPEALLIVSDIHNIEHEYYFNSVAKNEIKGLMGDLFDKMEVNKQLIRPLSSFERRRIGKNQYLYLNNANYQLFYFYEGNFFQAARKFSLFQDFMYSQQIETLQVDSSLFSNYIQELFQFSETKEIIIDQTTSRITNDFEVIIHPIRLAVVKLLVFYVELTRNTLVKKIQVPTSSLDRNIKKLIEENLVAKEYRFIDSQTEVVYTLTNAGNLLYNRLKAALN